MVRFHIEPPENGGSTNLVLPIIFRHNLLFIWNITILCFAWVACIVEPRRERLHGGFAFADVHGNNSSDGDRQDSFLKKSNGRKWYFSR
mgnify:CR=1 FL=1